MAKLYVLVADQAHARLYESPSLLEPLNEIEDFSNEVARHHEHDLVSDAQGRSSSPGNSYSHHPLGKENEARVQHLDHFARVVMAELEKLLYNVNDAKLYLIAPPKFLGVLRKHLGHSVQKALVGELDKDITDCSPAKIVAYIRELESVS